MIGVREVSDKRAKALENDLQGEKRRQNTIQGEYTRKCRTHCEQMPITKDWSFKIHMTPGSLQFYEIDDQLEPTISLPWMFDLIL